MLRLSQDDRNSLHNSNDSSKSNGEKSQKSAKSNASAVFRTQCDQNENEEGDNHTKPIISDKIDGKFALTIDNLVSNSPIKPSMLL